MSFRQEKVSWANQNFHPLSTFNLQPFLKLLRRFAPRNDTSLVDCRKKQIENSSSDFPHQPLSMGAPATECGLAAIFSRGAP
jgi:hypothetical protein